MPFSDFLVFFNQLERLFSDLTACSSGLSFSLARHASVSRIKAPALVLASGGNRTVDGSDPDGGSVELAAAVGARPVSIIVVSVPAATLLIPLPCLSGSGRDRVEPGLGGAHAGIASSFV